MGWPYMGFDGSVVTCYDLGWPYMGFDGSVVAKGSGTRIRRKQRPQLGGRLLGRGMVVGVRTCSALRSTPR